jgi:hypothetical protein
VGEQILPPNLRSQTLCEASPFEAGDDTCRCRAGPTSRSRRNAFASSSTVAFGTTVPVARNDRIRGRHTGAQRAIDTVVEQIQYSVVEFDVSGKHVDEEILLRLTENGFNLVFAFLFHWENH